MLSELRILTLLTAGLVCAAVANAREQSFCERVAGAAYEANRNLDTRKVEQAYSAPFARDWLVRSRLPSEEGETQPGVLPLDFGELNQRHPHLYEIYIRWNTTVGLLPIAGRFLTVRAAGDYGTYRKGWSTGLFLKSVLDGGELVCAFDNRVHEFMRPDYDLIQDRETCKAIVTDTDNLLTSETDVPLEARQVLFDTGPDRSGSLVRWRDMIVRGIAEVDVDGDGIAERLASIAHEPGSGHCGYWYYDVLKPDTMEFSDNQGLRRLVADAQSSQYPDSRELSTLMDTPLTGRCFRRTSVRKWNGRVLFERDGIKREKGSATDAPDITHWGGPLQHTVRTIENGEVKTLCRSLFSIEPVVVYDRERAGAPTREMP